MGQFFVAFSEYLNFKANYGKRLFVNSHVLHILRVCFENQRKHFKKKSHVIIWPKQQTVPNSNQKFQVKRVNDRVCSTLIRLYF